METYYIVEVKGRYYEMVVEVMSDIELYTKIVETTDSLLECKRFQSYEEAKSISDKYDGKVKRVVIKALDVDDVI